MSSTLYPLNYYLTRPDTRKFFKDLEAYRNGVNPQLAQKLALTYLVPWLESQGWDFSAETAIVSQELQGMLAWGDWAMNGKRIVSINESLGQAFEHSDCMDMRISDVLVEKGPTYLHFEGQLQQPIELAENAHFEGAYVLNAPGVGVRIVLCARMHGNYTGLRRWQERYDLRIASKHLGLPADTAIDFALADDLADLRDAGAKLAAKREGNGARSVEMLIERMNKGHAAYRAALRLILNALAYLKGYSDDSRIAWPSLAPERLVSQAQAGTPREQARGRSKLWELGFVPVTYLGEQFAETIVRNTLSHEMRAHWRKGHWRNQPHGPAMALRKLIWLRPMLIGAAHEESTSSPQKKSISKDALE